MLVEGKPIEIRITTPPSQSSATYQAEIAITPEQHRKGLSRREEMPKNSAMLFVFDPPAPASFWMKDTWIPLTLLYFDEDGLLLSVHTMEVEPNPSHPIKHYEERREVSAAVELPTVEVSTLPSLVPGRTALQTGSPNR